MNTDKRTEIIHWHRRYYAPCTIASLVDLPVDVVQKVVYAYEESQIPKLERTTR
jgi:hypothetical protein